MITYEQIEKARVNARNDSLESKLSAINVEIVFSVTLERKTLLLAKNKVYKGIIDIEIN